MRAVDGKKLLAVAATSASFHLEGGVYQTVATGNFTGGGSVSLRYVSADGVTPTAGGVNISANGQNTASLPPGDYVIFVSGVIVAVDVQVTRIPQD